MDNQEDEGVVWPPPPINAEARGVFPSGRLFSRRYVLLSLGLGVVLSVFDVTRADFLVDWLDMLTSTVLAFWRPRVLWFSVLVLSACLYAAHIVAIRMGVHHPYVERDMAGALVTWLSLVPFTICGLLGALVKSIISRPPRGSG